MRERAALERLLEAVSERGEPFTEYFRRAAIEGLDLALALDELVHACLSWRTDDPIEALVEHLGDPELAQAIVARTHRFAGVDVRVHLVELRAARAVEAAFARSAPPGELLGLIRSAGALGRSWWLERMVLGYGVAELVRLPDLDALEWEAIGTGIRKRMTVADVVEQLDEADIAPREISELLIPFWGAPRSSEIDPWAELLDLYTAVLESEAPSVRPAMALADRHMPVGRWLPVLRRRGLGASAAALHLGESARATGGAEIAATLHDGGYGDDEVLRALLENGISTASALDQLREQGWNVARLVGALHARGTLLPEIRDRLSTLGVPRAAQRTLLLPIAGAALTDLVLDGISPPTRLA